MQQRQIEARSNYPAEVSARSRNRDENRGVFAPLVMGRLGANWRSQQNNCRPGQVWYQADSPIISRGDRFRSNLSSREPVKSAGRRVCSAAQAPTAGYDVSPRDYGDFYKP